MDLIKLNFDVNMTGILVCLAEIKDLNFRLFLDFSMKPSLKMAASIGITEIVNLISYCCTFIFLFY